MSQTLTRSPTLTSVRAWAAARPLVIDTLLALALTGLSLFTLAAGAGDLGSYDPRDLALLVLQTLPLALRRVWPVPVFIVTFGALCLQAFVAENDYSAPIGSLIALYTVAQRLDRPRSGFLTAVVAITFVVINVQRGALPAGLSGLVQTELAILTVWTLGTWSRERHAHLWVVEERNAQLERERLERDARAVSVERERIARELHDVVTHHVSVIVIQAGAAERALDRRPDDARKAIAAIDSTARLALGDMRRMLGILGTPGSAGELVGAGDTTSDPLAPMPGFDRLGELLEQVRAAGLPVELTVEGEARALDPGIELSAYRIIQEALTNSLKHARGATAQARLTYRPAELEIEVSDRGGSGDRDLGVPGESGRGLIGMRERVAVFGGRFEAGPVPGGFRVWAVLPLSPVRAGASA